MSLSFKSIIVSPLGITGLSFLIIHPIVESSGIDKSFNLLFITGESSKISTSKFITFPSSLGIQFIISSIEILCSISDEIISVVLITVSTPNSLKMPTLFGSFTTAKVLLTLKIFSAS